VSFVIPAAALLLAVLLSLEVEAWGRALPGRAVPRRQAAAARRDRDQLRRSPIGGT